MRRDHQGEAKTAALHAKQSTSQTRAMVQIRGWHVMVATSNTVTVMLSLQHAF